MHQQYTYVYDGITCHRLICGAVLKPQGPVRMKVILFRRGVADEGAMQDGMIEESVLLHDGERVQHVIFAESNPCGLVLVLGVLVLRLRV